MRNKTINALIAIAVSSMVLFSCTKEPPIEPNAHFSTKLVDNTAYAGETFYLYLTNTQGEFYTLFTGLTEATTYDPNDPTRIGTSIPSSTDSFAVTVYNSGGTYPMTLVASSSGNWAEDFKTDVYTMDLKVDDRRSAFTSFSINKVEGVFVPDGNMILFYATKGTDLSNLKPKWLTASANAKVYVNGELQDPGRTVQNFNPDDPNANESKTIDYTVEAPSGETTVYHVKYVFNEPSPDTSLFSLESDIGARFNISIDNGTVEMLYYSNTDPASFKLQATAGVNATVKVGNVEIQDRANTVNLVANPTIKVIAENGTEKDYAVTLTVIDVFTSFKFTQIEDDLGILNDLFPVPNATIDVTAKTINIDVFGYSTSTNNKLVATFEGIDHQTVKVGENNTTLVSGTTVYTYDTNPVEVKLYDGTRLLDTYTLTIGGGK
ncbi:MAG TPA: hypothetical protein VE870_02735 [Bacteroidales bacterium]|nr:hypothetical protein [Bacteroidales bacterium]